MRNRFIALFIIVLSTVRCSGMNRLKENNDHYPKERYLSATASGQSESEAKNRAIAEISRIFESRIISDTSDRIEAVIDEAGEQIKQEIRSNIRIVSETELKGVQIFRSWQDEKERIFYATAVLEKKVAGLNWQAEIKVIDKRIEGEFEALEEMFSSIMRLQMAKKIIASWLERETIVSRLRVLGFSSESPARYNISEVIQLLPKLKVTILIFLAIEGDQQESVAKKVSAFLSSKGFSVTTKIESADVIVKGSVFAVPLEVDNPGWKYARVTLSLAVMDSFSGTVVGEVTENKRSAQLSFEEAVVKGLEKLYPLVFEKLIVFFQ